MVICLSPTYKDTDFSKILSLDDKIAIFEDRVKGWQLNIAKKCAEIPHSGFAVLHIVISYVEAIAKYQAGFVQNRKSRDYFQQGLLEMIPDLKNYSEQDQKEIAKKLYYGVRCGLYHGGMISKGVFITGEINTSVVFFKEMGLYIHPNRLVDLALVHFDKYVEQLKDLKNSELRKNFEKRFDA